MTRAQQKQREQQHPRLPEEGTSLEGQPQPLQPRRGAAVSRLEQRKDLLPQPVLHGSLTYHLHLTEDMITDSRAILLILGDDKYIFDIFILSDSFDCTGTTRITALVSAVLISAAQGKIANIK